VVFISSPCIGIYPGTTSICCLKLLWVAMCSTSLHASSLCSLWLFIAIFESDAHDATPNGGVVTLHSPLCSGAYLLMLDMAYDPAVIITSLFSFTASSPLSPQKFTLDSNSF